MFIGFPSVEKHSWISCWYLIWRTTSEDWRGLWGWAAKCRSTRIQLDKDHLQTYLSLTLQSFGASQYSEIPNGILLRKVFMFVFWIWKQQEIKWKRIDWIRVNQCEGIRKFNENCFFAFNDNEKFNLKLVFKIGCCTFPHYEI